VGLPVRLAPEKAGGLMRVKIGSRSSATRTRRRFSGPTRCFNTGSVRDYSATAADRCEVCHIELVLNADTERLEVIPLRDDERLNQD
jgi:hypothetical protein